jgi:hypothetical protein
MQSAARSIVTARKFHAPSPTFFVFAISSPMTWNVSAAISPSGWT